MIQSLFFALLTTSSALQLRGLEEHVASSPVTASVPSADLECYGTYVFKTPNGRFLSAKPNGEITTEETVGLTEEFLLWPATETEKMTGTFALRTLYSTYLQFERDGTITQQKKSGHLQSLTFEQQSRGVYAFQTVHHTYLSSDGYRVTTQKQVGPEETFTIHYPFGMDKNTPIP